MPQSFTPMHTFIVKVASRCNLDCDYCYMYKLADQSWRHQPAKMRKATAVQLARRIREHAITHQLSMVKVILHGGEPFALGVEYLRKFCDTIIQNTTGIKIEFGAQTNGTLWNKEILDFCLEYEISVGLSLDGPRSANDMHRLDHLGQTSFEAAEEALKLLASPQGRPIWGGLLCVIDLRNDPLDIYRYFRAYSPPMIDFLFPLAHWDSRPPGKEEDRLDTTPYADWLLEVFHDWYRQPYANDPAKPIRIRKLSDIIAMLLGKQAGFEEIGLNPVDFIIVETNGDIEAVDTLKVTYPGATKLGLNVFQNGFDDLQHQPLVIARQERWSSLSETCKQCPLVKVCGGGYFPHRFSGRQQFDNPSVYCADLKKLIWNIRNTLADDLNRLAIPA